PVVISPQLDNRVLLFSLLAAVISALLFGLAPAWQSLEDRTRGRAEEFRFRKDSPPATDAWPKRAGRGANRFVDGAARRRRNAAGRLSQNARRGPRLQNGPLYNDVAGHIVCAIHACTDA